MQSNTDSEVGTRESGSGVSFVDRPFPSAVYSGQPIYTVHISTVS